MTKTCSLLALIALLPIFIYGQNYQTVTSGKVSYFQNGIKIKAISIDSIEYETDSLLYPFYNIQQMSDYCFSNNEASWIGSKIEVTPSGLNLFYNKNNDTITINTQAKLNDSWIAFNPANGTQIIATVTDYEMESFLGLQDSVKTISFQAYDQDNAPIEHNINSKSLKISKNHGFIKTLNFYLFPDFEASYFDETVGEWDLAGMTNPVVGVQNLTWLDVHDYNPGDEIHVLYNYSSIDPVNESGISIQTKSIYRYINRENFVDSIRYTYIINQSENQILNGVSTWEFLNEERTRTEKKDPIFDRLPDQISTNESEVFFFTMANENLISKTDLRPYNSFVDGGNTNCLTPAIADGCFSNEDYFEGLGGPYYSCENAFSLGGADRTLVYYKKGETTWGTPLVIASIYENEGIAKVEIYPNPASESLIVKLDRPLNNLYIELFSVSGTLIAKHPLESTTNNINIQNIQKGLYIYKVSNKTSILNYNKLVIE